MVLEYSGHYVNVYWMSEFMNKWVTEYLNHGPSDEWMKWPLFWSLSVWRSPVLVQGETNATNRTTQFSFVDLILNLINNYISNLTNLWKLFFSKYS